MPHSIELNAQVILFKWEMYVNIIHCDLNLQICSPLTCFNRKIKSVKGVKGSNSSKIDHLLQLTSHNH